MKRRRPPPPRRMKIVVTKSNPEPGQDSIKDLIGKVYDAELDDDNVAWVDCPEFGGPISLQPSEWTEA